MGLLLFLCHVASFQGGYQREEWDPALNGPFSIHLKLRTLQNSGLLLLVNGSNGILALALDQGDQLVLWLEQYHPSSDSTVHRLSVGSVRQWRTLSVVVSDLVIQVIMDDIVAYTNNTSKPLMTSPQSIYFGGLENFFSPLYRHLPNPHFFIGCMQDVSIGSKVVHLNSNLTGLSAGCCIAPRYPAYCLSKGHNFVLSLPPSPTSASALHLSLRVRLPTLANGTILSSHSTSSSWHLHLGSGHLQLSANVSGSSQILDCRGDVGGTGAWHHLDLEFTPTSLSCMVDGQLPVQVSMASRWEWPRSLLRVGGAQPPIIGGSAEVLELCFQRMRLDGADLNMELFSNTSLVLMSNIVNWTNIQFSVSELLVAEHMQEILTSDIVRVDLPRDHFQDELSPLYEEELQRAVHFEASAGRYGHLYMSRPTRLITNFTLYNLVRGVADEQIGYVHTGGDNDTDKVLLSVWLGCGHQRHELPALSLTVNIEEREGEPRIVSWQDLELAVGTRVSVSPRELLVEDVADPTEILYSVRRVEVQGADCSSCSPPGVLVNNDGIKMSVFSQDDVNKGLLHFQHFERFSTALILVHLSATASNKNFNVSFHVQPLPAHLKQSLHQQTLYVKMAGMALVQPRHLSVEASFAGQDPVITYDLVSEPMYGVLQLRIATPNTWMQLHPLNRSQSPLHSPHSFTQRDIQSGLVRYVRSASSSSDLSAILDGVETISFQVHSFNLSGPQAVLRIETLLDAFLFQPSIAISMSPLVLDRENSSAVITTAQLNTSLDSYDYAYLAQDRDYEIDIHQLGIVYHLVESPSYGALELDSTVLTVGDNFTWEDLSMRRLIYRHFGTEEHQDSFTFHAEASSTAYLPIRAPNLTANLTLSIHITATNNHRPVITLNDPIRPPEGMAVQVTPQNLNVEDADVPSHPIRIILRKLKKYVAIGHFVLRSNSTLPVQEFTMEDVRNNSVLFVHWLNVSSPLESHVGIKVLHEQGDYVKEVMRIAATPLELSVSAALSMNSTCVALIKAQGYLTLTASLLRVVLRDAHGNDHNLIENILVSESSSGSSLGQLYKTNTTGVTGPISQFRFQDLESIQYVLDNRSRLATVDTLHLTLSYGHSTPVSVSVPFCVRPVLVPLEVRVSKLTLQRGTMEYLTSQHIYVTSSRPGEDGALRVEVVEQPRNGRLLNSVTDQVIDSQLSFSLEQLHNGSIMYEFEGNLPTLSDHFVFKVCSLNYCLGHEVLHIKLYPIDISYNISRVSVLEVSTYQFNLTDFNIQAPPRFTSIKLIIGPKKPANGELLINTSIGFVPASYLDLNDVRYGRLYYNQSVNAEKTNDSFDVRLEAEVNGILQQQVQFHMMIDIIPVNNRIPELLTTSQDARVTVVREGTVQITSAHISAHDYDSDTNDEDLVWSSVVFSPTFNSGYLYLDDNPNEKGLRRWTEGDIRNGRLHYRHVGNPLLITGATDLFFLDVTDGKYHVQTNLFIEVKEVIILHNRTTLKLQEGGSVKISFTHLYFYALNTEVADSDLLIDIKVPPSHGMLRLNGSDLSRSTQLTQETIGMDLLEYIHDNSENFTDSFIVEARIRQRGPNTVQVTMDIMIEPVNDQPPVVTIHGPLYVVELQRVVVSTSSMSISDPDARTDQHFDSIKCTLTKRLGRGKLIRRRHHLEQDVQSFSKYDLDNQGLFYQHLDTGHQEPDYLIFRVTDGPNPQPEISTLRIVVLPAVVPVTTKTLIVNENEGASITEEELLVSNRFMMKYVGLITLQEGSGPRHGQLVNRRTLQAVNTFTTHDITYRYIYYDHHGDEIRDDSFIFVYTILDPAGFNRTSDNLTFHISITPVDDQPPVIHQKNTVLRLWAMETVPLTTAQFNVSDPDTPDNRLNFTVRISQLDSYIAFSNNTAQFIHWFTLADLLAGKVVLVHMNGPYGNISYTVWDSFYHVNGTVNIRADNLTLDCQTTLWRIIHVGYLASVPVTSDNLHCTTAEDNGDREILYSFPSPQKLGHFEVDLQLVNSFNSSTLRAGRVWYVHTQTAYWEETETVGVDVVSHPAESAHQLPVRVHVQYPEGWTTNTVAVNSGLQLLEGGTRCLNSSMLDARNWRYTVWSEKQLNTTTVAPGDLEIVFKLAGDPRHGFFTAAGEPTDNFTQSDLNNQSVCYTHDDSEHFQEELSIDIQVAFPNGSTVGVPAQVKYSILITPVNDQQPLLRGTLRKIVVESFEPLLQASDLNLMDGDTPPWQLLIHLHSVPSNTDLLVNGSVMTVGTHFSQLDINSDLVHFKPKGNGSDYFLFTFSDGNFTSPVNSSFELQVEVHKLHLVTNETIEYAQNMRETLVTEHHLNTFTNALPSLTIFTLQSPPSHGRLVMNNKRVDQFSQQDIYDNRVKYFPHPGTQDSSDVFTVAVKNHNLSLPEVQMNVHVLVWGKVSPMTSISFNPLATPSPDTQLPAIPLPADILILDELEKGNQAPPIIEVVSGPLFGHLERHVNRRKRSSSKLTTFRYEDLQQGWIVYVWDYDDPLPNNTVLDVIRVLVRADHYQPGEAELILNVTTPMRVFTSHTSTYSQSPATLLATTMTAASLSEEPSNGFPFFTLVPFLGIFCFLVVLIAVIVCCCVCQQNHKLKLGPGSLSSPHQSPPWSASPTLQPGQLMSYDMDPSGGNFLGEDQHNNNSETSSGFSEPDASFHGSPVQSYTVYQSPSLSVSRQQIPHPRSRVRSNVSITFSSQHSTTSEISYEDEAEHMRSLYALSSPRYHSSADPVPVRPSSHTAAFKHSTTAAAVHSDMVQDHHGYQQPQPSQQPPHKQIVQEDPDLDCTRLPDIRDHDLNALFHAPNPVLKKEEYWI